MPEQDKTTKDLENRPITGETIERGNKQEFPTGREWDAEKKNGAEDLEEGDKPDPENRENVRGKKVPDPMK